MDASIVAVLLAHQGGWDEALLIAGPVVAIVVLLRIAKRRVDRASSMLGPSSDEPAPH